MKINQISNKVYLGNDAPENVKETKKTKETKIQDKLELSEEAKKIQKSQIPVNKLDKIKEKISSKFYESDEVINKTAEKMLKDIIPG